MSLSAETKALVDQSIQQLVSESRMREMPPIKAIAFALFVDALNGALCELARFVPRQTLADYVQTWATVLAAEDAAEKAKRS